MRIRVLPVMILFAFVLLSLQITNIWKTLTGLSADGLNKAVTTVSKKGNNYFESALAAGESDTKASEGDKFVEQVGKRNSLGSVLFTDSEVNILSKLSNRRKQLDNREAQLDNREKLLAAAEKRLNSKIADLKKLQSELETQLKVSEEQASNQIISLVKTYEAMKPQGAAVIFESLDREVLLRIASRMKQRIFASILSAMSPEKAREITVELAEYRKLSKG